MSVLLGDCDVDQEMVDDGLPLTVAVVLHELDSERDELLDAVAVLVGDSDVVRVTEVLSVWVELKVGLADSLIDGLADKEGENEGLGLTLKEEEALFELVTVALGESVTLRLPVAVSLTVAVRLDEKLSEVVALTVDVDDALTLSVMLLLIVPLTDVDMLRVADSDEVRV